MSIPTHHPYPFDPTHGLGLDALLALQAPEAPPGFDVFWRARHVTARAVDPRPRLSESHSGHPDWHVQDIVYTSTDDVSIGGWLLLPKAGPIRRGLVVGHGYGGREQPDFDVPVKETAVLFPCCRGLSRSRRPPISSESAWHVLHDIDKPERYILGGCVEDLWVAVSVLDTLYPGLAGRIGYSGISFGGGLGALAIPFDERIDRGHLVVPTFGNMPLWLTLPSVGSAESVQRYAKTHGEVRDTLRLFDAASAARRITVPMLVAVARFDPAVAPPCQFSVANALDHDVFGWNPSKDMNVIASNMMEHDVVRKPVPTFRHHALATSNPHETVILDAGHFDYPGQEEQHALLAAKVGRFFGAT